jgi:uncharacterized protein (TIGR02996 family)
MIVYDRSVEAELLADVVAHPDDDGPRLVLADWWTQRGDPRGEFVVAACAASRESRPGGDWRLHARYASRADALRKQYEADWLAALGIPGAGVTWDRGFVERLSVNATPTHTAALYRQPLRALWLHGDAATALGKPWPSSLDALVVWRDQLAAIAQSALASRLRTLDLHGCALGDAGIHRLAALALPRLRGLEITKDVVGPAGVVALCAGRRLVELHLAECQLDSAALRALAGCADVCELTKLCLWNNPIDGGGIAALAASPYLANLKELLLERAPLGDSIGTLASLPRLERIQAFECDIGPPALRALASESQLDSLELGTNPVCDAGAAAIAEGFDRLLALDLHRCQLSCAGVLAIARSPHLRRLEWLELAGNDLAGIGTGAAELVQPGLASLVLDECNVDDVAIEALAHAPALADACHLYLARNPFGDRGARALATSPYLDDIISLTVDGAFSERVRGELRERFGDRVSFAG